MSIHILGNGPSIQFFDRDAWPETDVFVGCNFSDPSFRLHYTSVIDVRAMKSITAGRIPPAPLLLSTRAAEYGDKNSSDWRDRIIGIEAIVGLARDRRISRNLSMNSAQHAVVYTLDTYIDHSEVHLWGIDSFWSDDLKSTTDAIVRQERHGRRNRPQITRQWNGYWHKIMSDHTNHVFVIHRPSRGAELVSGFSDVSNFRVVDEKL